MQLKYFYILIKNISKHWIIILNNSNNYIIIPNIYKKNKIIYWTKNRIKIFLHTNKILGNNEYNNNISWPFLSLNFKIPSKTGQWTRHISKNFTHIQFIPLKVFIHIHICVVKKLIKFLTKYILYFFFDHQYYIVHVYIYNNKLQYHICIYVRLSQ